MEQFDVLVVGSGGAGQRAALEAAHQEGLRVALITKIFPSRSATAMAQGGINGVLNNVAKEDTIEDHIFDTVKGSDYLADQDAVEFFINRCPELIKELDYFGVPFSRTSENKIAQRNFGGQAYPRTCYSADKTGHVILHTLYEQCLKENVHFLQDWYLLDIVKTDDGAVGGVVAWNMKEGRVEKIATTALVIATGGAGRMYWTRTSNPYLSTGDGMAACFRAGVALKDPEMVQFHPTGLGKSGILMSEAVRGEGGYLLNNKGERFMKDYAPSKMELAPRDVVAKAIETEIAEGRGFGTGLDAYVVADVRHLPKEVILEKLHGIRDLAITFEHADPLVQPIPIRPTCHYSMGGIDVNDYKTCGTCVPGLFAAGEAACVSIHGANRLGGNSLADAVVFGKVAGEGAVDYVKNNAAKDATKALNDAANSWEQKFREVTGRTTGRPISEIRDEMALSMWNNVGIFREEKKMELELETLNRLIEEYKTCYVGDTNRTFNMAFVNYIEVGSLLTVAKAVTLGALRRKESRGSHLREDFAKRDDANFLNHTVIKLKEDGEYEVGQSEVVITRFEPKERTY
ncbi:FAD-binding protein [Veillonella criceti]|uniref:Succinate dehydrogenase flavoprotein subunit n=1 Tax=Veillonella criceti TaxID=103891 RepID=A0A380NNH6_9FIRM|nr:FAD-binding protein [Veillonella criceti]SUP44219.1 Succinate dehydrogenase flavoprotein subunit [Veillonella criceti]